MHQIPEITTFVWLSKVEPVWWNAVEVSDHDEWLIFPWESQEYAQVDEVAYRLSRSSSK